MTGLRAFLRRHSIPDLPRDIREDYVVAAATQVQKQARPLFIALFLTTPIAIYVARPDAGLLIKWILPLVMGTYCLLGFLKLSRDMEFATKPWRAEKFVLESALSSGFGAVVCSLWCVLSWIGAEGSERLHFPVILVMGALASAYCLASIRLGALLHLVVNIVPISILMLLSGDRMDFAAAASLILCGLFQWHMINNHIRRVVELLELKRHSQQLALTDPLTGLLNRRALLDFAEALGEDGEPCRLLLIDVDHFKAVNDGHGHDTGDCVLVEVARLIDAHAGNNIAAARLGGEEFALLGSADALPEALALALLAEVRGHAMPHGEQLTISIGVADGLLPDETAWRSLYSAADAGLYVAKAQGRNRLARRETEEPADEAVNSTVASVLRVAR